MAFVRNARIVKGLTKWIFTASLIIVFFNYKDYKVTIFPRKIMFQIPEWWTEDGIFVPVILCHE